MSSDMPLRVRFAPSPTGYLHVGGARTALFNWLLARRSGGVFILRIEDTDRERSSDEMTAAILDGMSWLGLDWDEGPHHQADGLDRHRADAWRLLERGHAYRCFCTPAELEERRAAAPGGGAGYRYDRRCARLPEADVKRRVDGGEPFTLRFLVPDGTTRWDDAVHGEIAFENADLEDFIVLRSDGTPIYNMAVVSDDIEMAVTHVIRGDDHISNTPKQILLYQALGARLPVFAHVPMILGADGRRLSKRHGATAIGEYEKRGILPDAMVNFLALLGWSPGDDEEIFSREELVRRFSLEGINRKSAIFDTQKLEWMNGRYLAERPAAELVALLRAELEEQGSAEPLFERDEEWWHHLVELLKVRARTIPEMAAQAKPYLRADVQYDEAAVAKHWKDALASAERLEQLRDRFAGLDSFDEASLDAGLRGLAEEQGVGAGKLIHPLRVALTGLGSSFGIFDVARLLGRDEVLRRVDAAIGLLRSRGGTPAG